jgi:competence protein ComEA
MSITRLLSVVAVLAFVATPAFPEQKKANEPAPPAKSTPAPAPAAKSATPAATPAAKKVDLNTATAEELDGLPQIGPARAKAIVEARAKGKFKNWDDFVARKVVPSNAQNAIKDLVSF